MQQKEFIGLFPKRRNAMLSVEPLPCVWEQLAPVTTCGLWLETGRCLCRRENNGVSKVWFFFFFS